MFFEVFWTKSSKPHLKKDPSQLRISINHPICRYIRHVCTTLTFLFRKVMDSESSENIYSILKTSFLGLFPCLGKAQSSQSDLFPKKIQHLKFPFYFTLKWVYLYLPSKVPNHKTPRKWTFQNQTKNSWKSELIILKNKKVRDN